MLHRFCSAEDCADGALPDEGVVMDAQGRLLGTTTADGPHHGGVVYALVPAGRKSQYTVVHGFCGEPECPDGFSPDHGLSSDAAGNLFGEAVGGTRRGGAIYKLRGTEFHIAYEFCAETGCPDGSGSIGGLLPGPDGHLFGVTDEGGASDKGTIFELK